MSRVYWELVQRHPTLRSFLAARLLQEMDASNHQAISAYNDVLHYLDEQDRQQGEAMAQEAERIRRMRCSDFANELDEIDSAIAGDPS